LGKTVEEPPPIFSIQGSKNLISHSSKSLPFIIVPDGNEQRVRIIMMNDGQILGKRKEGVARLEFANMLSLYVLGRIGGI
jgi:hypothetical protein